MMNETIIHCWHCDKKFRVGNSFEWQVDFERHMEKHWKKKRKRKKG